MPSTPIRRYRHVPCAMRMQRRREARREKILQKQKREIKSMRITEENLKLRMDQLNKRLEEVEDMKRALENYGRQYLEEDQEEERLRNEQQREQENRARHCPFCVERIPAPVVGNQGLPNVPYHIRNEVPNPAANLPMRVILPTDRLGDLGRSFNVAVYNSNMTMCFGAYAMIDFLNAIAINAGYEQYQRPISAEELLAAHQAFLGIPRPPPLYQDHLVYNQPVLGQQYQDESDEEEVLEDDEPADDEVPEDPIDPVEPAEPEDYEDAGPVDYQIDPVFQQAVNTVANQMVGGVCQQIADALNIGLHNHPNNMVRIDVPGGGQFVMYYPKINHQAPLDVAHEEVVEDEPVQEDGEMPLLQALYPNDFEEMQEHLLRAYV